LERRIAMSRIVLTVMALIAMLAVGFEASAQSKKCPKGYYYDEGSGKCIARRGSG
jgi:hypothetical protein